MTMSYNTKIFNVTVYAHRRTQWFF
jgi:hypothetical protein